MPSARTTRNRDGFTLVELMVVLVIIGILIGFLVPMVLTAIRRGRVAEIRVEITQLDQAMESFRTRYGTYPPDGSNPVVTRRVIRKMFPRILPAELSAALSVMRSLDPAEAIPFWLRGFSDDPRRPFSGPGGPFNTTTERNDAGFMTFQEARLTIRLTDTSTGLQDDVNGVKWSYDEQLIHGRAAIENDVFPIYLMPRFERPYVYFDSRTYVHLRENDPLAPPPHYPPAAYQATTAIPGHVLPYRIDKVRRASVNDPVLFEFANKDRFQIVSCGLDEDFGGWPNGLTIAATLTAWPNVFKQFPSRLNFDTGDDTAVSNFSDGMLKDGK